jgi:hypothetical protein
MIDKTTLATCVSVQHEISFTSIRLLFTIETTKDGQIRHVKQQGSTFKLTRNTVFLQVASNYNDRTT